MIEFKNKEVVNKRYSVTVDEFMEMHCRGAQKYEDELDIYVASVLSGCRVRVLTVKLLPEEQVLDFSDRANIRRVLLRKFGA